MKTISECFKGGADVFLDRLYNQSKTASIRQRAHTAEGEFDSLFVVPFKIVIKHVHKRSQAHAHPRATIEHLILNPSKEAFTGGIVRRAAFPGH